MEAQEIIERFLRDNGYDGLVNVDWECGCGLDELVPCDGSISGCEPAYRIKCPCDEKGEHDACEYGGGCYSTQKQDVI